MLDLFVYGIAEARKKLSRKTTHLVTIGREDWIERPEWIDEEDYLHLSFDDVNDSKAPHAPTRDDIQKLIDYGQLAFSLLGDREYEMIVHCSAGVSRSPAAMYIMLADYYGRGHEADAAKETKYIRQFSFPNKLMIDYADYILKRGGALRTAANIFYS